MGIFFDVERPDLSSGSKANPVTASLLALAMLFFFSARVPAQSNPSRAMPRPFQEITDETGRKVRVPEPVQRIVSLAPSLTETLYALGAEDRLVGDTDFCDFPSAAQNKPKVRGAINPSLEEIVALHPDLVLVTKSLNRLETVSALERLGISTYATDPRTVNDVLSSTARLAGVLGIPGAGRALAQDLQRRLADLRARLAALPPRRVLFVVWTEPLISVGQKTFIADAIRDAGGLSVVDADQDWPQINLEEVIKLHPDFLVFASAHSELALREFGAVVARPGWRDLDAVRHRRFAIISDAINRPAPRLVSAIEDLARQLHPEAFSEDRSNGKESPAPAKPGPPFGNLNLLDTREVSQFLVLGRCACAH